MSILLVLSRFYSPALSGTDSGSNVLVQVLLQWFWSVLAKFPKKKNAFPFSFPKIKRVIVLVHIFAILFYPFTCFSRKVWSKLHIKWTRSKIWNEFAFSFAFFFYPLADFANTGSGRLVRWIEDTFCKRIWMVIYFKK